MKKKTISIVLALIMISLSFMVYVTSEKPTTPSPMPEALATAGLPVITLSQRGQVYDGAGKSVGGFKIRADNVTIMNCTVYASTDYSFDVQGDNLTVDNCNVFNNKKEGSVFDFILPDGSCVSGTTIRNVYADGDVGWGVTGRICGLTMSDSQFYRIGKLSSSGKHFFYLNHSDHVTLTNVYVEDVWNSCFKVVGNVSYIYFEDVTCKNVGTSKSYGSGLMIGEGGDTARQTDAHHLYLNGFTVINALDGAVVVDDSRKPVYEVYINGVYYPELKSMKTLPPVNNGETFTPTVTRTPTATRTLTQTSTSTATRTETPTPTNTPACAKTPLPVLVGDQHVGNYCP